MFGKIVGSIKDNPGSGFFTAAGIGVLAIVAYFIVKEVEKTKPPH
jgi:hypothetical protein